MSDQQQGPVGSGAVGPESVGADVIAAAIHSAPDAIIIVDRSGVIRFVNHSGAELFGYPAHELHGQPIEVLVPERFRAAHVDDRAVFSESPARRPMGMGFDLTARHRSGRGIPVEIGLSPVGESASYVVAVVRDITERRRVSQTLAAAGSQLAIAEDRERIARELHDTVIQRLFATGLVLQASAGRADVDTRIDEAVAGIDLAIKDLRTSIFTLHRPADALSIGDAVRITAEEARRILDCPLQVELMPEVDQFVPAALRDELVAVVREALTNAAKHSSARTVRLRVDVQDGHVVVHIVDDGVGFDAQSWTGGRGLAGLHGRAERLGGDCRIESAPGSGATITWRVPLPDPV
jgi:PAS domain S-box-containing protein